MCEKEKKELESLLNQLRQKNKDISPQIAEKILELDRKIERDKIDDFRFYLMNAEM